MKHTNCGMYVNDKELTVEYKRWQNKNKNVQLC